MIISHQQFELLEKCILERIIFTPPIKKSNVMQDEACFLYSVNGQSSLYSAEQKVELSSNDGVVFDDSPAHYIKVKRLEKSSELLKITTNRISDISFECGFNDLSHFSKSFIQYFGLTPSEYRDIN